MKKFLSIFLVICLLFSLVCTTVFANENIENENVLEDTLYKFDKLNEDGDILYDKKSPITLNGKNIKLNKLYEPCKEMFRGTWIATISNINFPSKPNLSFDELKSEFNSILDRVEQLNLNAIFFQVSPELDAFYESSFRPWSKYLTGKQGVKPYYINEGKDFLTYAISETKRRGIEFHAWFNPYRVTKDPKPDKSKQEILITLSENNFARQNEELSYLFQGKLFLDPGRKEVINFIKDTIHEFITKYDVDGIHFDDYFYPYGSESVNGKVYKFGDRDEDKVSFEINNRGIKDIKDWRRDNVNTLVKEVSSIIDHYNYTNEKSIQWGISPFGIYAHKGVEEKDGVKTGNLLRGSDTPVTSLSSYRDIYADTLYWVDNNLIDYVVPQIYWTFGKVEAPYEELVDFWSNALKDKRCQLYIGHGNYCIKEFKDKNWNNSYEITNQIKFNSKYDNIKGSVFFSVKDLNESLDVGNKRYGIYKKYITSLEEDILKYKTIVPKKPWLDFKNTSDVSEFRVLKGDSNKHYLFFKDKIDNDSKFYIVYGFKSEQDEDLNDPKNIVGIYGRDFSKEFQNIVIEDLDDEIKVFVITVQDAACMETNGIKHVFKI